jgi:D-alanine-D-alanine ligase
MTSRAPLTVVVLSGGISHERDVSLRSGRRVADGLHSSGARVIMREPDSTLLPYLRDNPPDVVWPALHGASGEDGALYALLELAGLPYVGSPSAAARLAWNKPTAKTLVARAGVATPASVTLPKETFRELGASSVLEAILSTMPAPLVVKPAQGGSAQGVSLVNSDADLPRAMVDAYTYVDVAMVEQRIVGTEISIGVIEIDGRTVTLPATEIAPLSGVYDYAARYNAGETRFYTPARLSDDVARRAADAALAAHSSLGLRHISRVDLIIAEDATPWFLEVNVMPGLTETSLVPQAIEASAHELGEIYLALAEQAIRDAADVS